jgi:hypothetical protein
MIPVVAWTAKRSSHIQSYAEGKCKFSVTLETYVLYMAMYRARRRAAAASAPPSTARAAARPQPRRLCAKPAADRRRSFRAGARTT